MSALLRLPILMSAPMISGLQHKRKTQTRRTSGLEEVPLDADVRFAGLVRDGRAWLASFYPKGRAIKLARCPYGGPGVRLYVRETIRRVELDELLESEFDPGPVRVAPGTIAIYDADKAPATAIRQWIWKSKVLPPIHMPRVASRFELDLRDVTVQRLHELTEGDAVEEGLEPRGRGWAWPGEKRAFATAREAYQAGWEWLNGEGSWARNPWVWRLTFAQVP